MALLAEIQAALLESDAPLSAILLKLRFLASRLGSEPLEEWIRHEMEGYPADQAVPDYRHVGPSYTATFSGPFGSGIKNAPIPAHLVDQFGGEGWTRVPCRQSMAELDDLIASATGGEGRLALDSSNLILLLQGNIYPDFTCVDVQGRVSKSALIAIQGAVRSKVLEFTIELERRIPAAALIALGPAPNPPATFAEDTTSITQTIFYGDVTNITNSGAGAQIAVHVQKNDAESFVKSLTAAGIAEEDAKELIEIVKSEDGGTKDEPFGKKAKGWFVDNIKKAANGTWTAGVGVASEVIKQALLKYYGIT